MAKSKKVSIVSINKLIRELCVLRAQAGVNANREDVTERAMAHYEGRLLAFDIAIDRVERIAKKARAS